MYVITDISKLDSLRVKYQLWLLLWRSEPLLSGIAVHFGPVLSSPFWRLSKSSVRQAFDFG
jgi:hypothetical protein